MLTDLQQDLRYAARVLRRAPGYTAVTAIVLGLGIGATTTLFGAINGVLRKPLPYHDPERLVTLAEESPRQQGARGGASAGGFADWRAMSRSFDGLAAYRPWGYVLTGDGGGAGAEPERVLGARASANLFALLGARPLLGRTFVDGEDQAGRDRVVVVSEALWRRRFGADAGLVGRALRLDGERYTVVGIVPGGSALPDAELWTPLAFAPYEVGQRGNRALSVVGRLAPGVTLDAARAEMREVGRTLAARHADAADWEVAVASLREDVVGDTRTPLLLLFGATCAVLLVACANLANLMLARGTARRRELAVRAAIGAGRGRLVRQLLAESALTVAAGGALGILIALAGTGLLARLGPEYLPRSSGIGVDAAVLGFALLVVLAAGAGLATIPAREAAALDLNAALRSGADGGGGRRGAARGIPLRDLLVVGQVAMALFLLVGGGLLARSFLRARSVELGFTPAGVLSMTVSLPGSRYPRGDQRAAFFQELARRVEALPGVQAAGLASHLPLAAGGPLGDVVVEGRDARATGEVPRARLTATSPGYFRTVGIRLLAGRPFADGDRADGRPVVIVDEAFARRAWPGDLRAAVGQRVRVGVTLGADTAWREIVGVVAGVRAASVVHAPEPTIYVPHAQTAWPTMSLVVHTGCPLGGCDPARHAGAVRAQVLALDPAQPVYNVRSLEQMVARALAGRRFQMLLLGGFAVAALLLAVVGVYGVLAFAVAQRTRELGIRLALGAQRREVRALVLRQALGRIGAGLLLGAVAAAAGSRLLRAVLFEVSPWDPATFAGAALLLAAAGLAASYLPARRATRVDPMVAVNGRD